MEVIVADSWFERTVHEHGITQLAEPHVNPIIRGNIWHVRGRDRDLIVDTGVGIASVADAIVDLVDRPIVCVATHAHYDHVGCMHEFDIRLVHPIAARKISPHSTQMPLRWSAFEPATVERVRSIGYEIDGDELIDALPRHGFDIDTFRPRGFAVTGEIGEGATIDLGDRQFEVLELPGHTPGSIGLWDPARRVLFSGDAVYDGPLIDFLPESNPAIYVATMRRLKDLPVDVVHAGHGESFGQGRLIEIADTYLSTAG